MMMLGKIQILSTLATSQPPKHILVVSVLSAPSGSGKPTLKDPCLTKGAAGLLKMGCYRVTMKHCGYVLGEAPPA